MNEIRSPRIRRVTPTLLVLLALAGGGLSAQEPAPPLERLTFSHLLPPDGLPSVQLRRIIQDRQGFMWFATYEGLVRFDSREFRTFRHDAANARSLSNNTTWDLAEDAAGNLWVGSDGGLDLWRRDSEQFTPIGKTGDDHHRLSSPFVRRLVLDGDHGLWIATFGGGLNWLDRRTGRVDVYRARPAEPDALADDYLLDLFRDSRGTLWIGTQSAGLVAFDPSTRRFRTFRHDPADSRSLAGVRVSAIGEDAEGSLWVGTTGGLSRLGRERRAFEHVPFVAGDPAALQGSKVDAIVRDRDGSMWFGTDGGGLSQFVPATRSLVHFRHVRGDPTTPLSNVVPAFYQDRAGDYWIGHWPWGVSYANRLNASVQLVRTIPGQPATIPDDTIHALLEEPSGDLLVGTDNAGLCRFDARARTWTSYLPPAIPGQAVAKAVMTIARDDAGRIWAGTWRGGVRRIDPDTGQVTLLRADPRRPNALSSDFVLSVVRDRVGRMWVSTFGGGVNRYVPEQGGFVHYRHDPANPRTLNHDGVGCLMVARGGALWAGTQAGLVRWDAARDDWERVECAADHPGALAGNFVNDILEAPDGNLWVATAGGGLNHVDLTTRRCQAFGVREGLPTTVIRSLIADDRGALWLGTTEGLAVFDPATKRVRVFDENNGIHGRVFNRGARWRLSDGRLMMGGAGGFEIFDPRRMGPDDTVPQVVFTGLEVLNQPVTPEVGSILERSISLTRRIAVPSRAAVISFQFAALSYRSPTRTRLEYLLEGFDPAWRASGPERRATYTNLSPGTYRFRVRAANGEGVWSGPGAALELIVVPAWWQTWWFRGGLFASVAGLLVAGSVTVSRRRYRDQLLAARRDAEQALERQRVSDVIRESEERLQMALKGGDLGTWDWDVASGHVVFSPQSAGMIGYDDGELPPHFQAWRDHIHPDDADRTLRALDDHLRGDAPNYESEYRLRHKDGHWVWILARGRVIARAADGAPVRVSGTHLDITARRQAEEQQRTLEALLAQAQKMESVGRLAGGVAHDLNNMLTPILGHSELLITDLPPDDPQHFGLQEIRRAAERSRDLIGQLLAFARKQTLEMKRLDLNGVIQDLATMLRRTLRENIAIDYDLAPDLPAVSGDALQLQQILLNLSINAQDAMPDGGRLFIETSLRAVAHDDPPDVVPPGRYVVLTVSDTGAGMDEATRQRVFEPFFTTKDLGRGTGLGLATVHGIVEQHEGHIHVDSDTGRGTIFTVHFVAQDEPAVAATRSQPFPAGAPADETILIVEDQVQVRELCMLVLAKAGYTVLAAASAADALELSAQQARPIDLLLTDVVLPDINGRALYEQLAQQRPTLRVIYMSGYTTDVITHHGVLDDGLSYLQKPFDGETLKAKIRQVLDADAVDMEPDDERR
jgi:PAS domain S-box-containing protein